MHSDAKAVETAQAEPPPGLLPRLARLLSPGIPALPADFPEPINWDEVVHWASRWRVAAPLYQVLRRPEWSGRLDPRHMTDLSYAYLANFQRNRRFHQEILRVLDCLGGVGIVPLILKGGVQLVAPPSGNPALRFITDVDLLLPPGQVDAASAALATLNYRVDPAAQPAALLYHLAPLWSDDGVVIIEPHTKPYRYATTEVTAAYFARAVSIDLSGRRILAPSLPDRLVLNCLHAQISDYGHSLGRIDLRQLLDFAEICVAYRDQIDWPAVMATAEAADITEEFLTWAYAARALMAAPLPATLRFSPRHARLVRRSQRTKHPDRRIDDLDFVWRYARAILSRRHQSWLAGRPLSGAALVLARIGHVIGATGRYAGQWRQFLLTRNVGRY